MGSKILRRLSNLSLFFCLLSPFHFLNAQDLDPRAYAWAPVNGTLLVTGFSFNTGSVLTDPSSPIKDLKAKVETPSIGIARTFNLFGMTAQAFAALPYSWAQVSGKVSGQAGKITRSGFSDFRLRFSVLFHGAPAVNLAEFKKAQHKTILGFSLNIIAPTGQYSSERLINLGTHRWSFRPELALSQPIGKKWLMDLYAGVWMFTDNNDYYPGESNRSQKPMGTIQGHISYNLNLGAWLAFDATFYTGGQSSIDQIYKDDRQSNVRLGGTLVVPVGKRSSIKLAGSTGAVVRTGSDFTTFSLGWQTGFYKQPKKATP